LGRGETTRRPEKARLDFRDAEKIFRGFTLTAEDTREAYGERRFLTLGLLHDQVTHTERGEDIRVISIRKATKHEARYYFSQISDRPPSSSKDD
jgi:uncharacterized protein